MNWMVWEGRLISGMEGGFFFLFLVLGGTFIIPI